MIWLYNRFYMLAFINRCVKAPLAYMADLRAVSFKEYLLIGSNFSPSYPIMMFTGLGFTLMYCAILIYFVFTSSFSQSCYSGIQGATYLIAILYPIQTILCFICLTGSIALSKNNCWKVVMMLVFGPILCGFGFGEVGIIQICLLSGNHQMFPSPGVLSQPGFVNAMVYLYISFLALYFVLIPSINYLYERQREEQIASQVNQSQLKEKKEQQTDGEKPQPVKESNCCNKTITILYYICNALFVVAVIFIIFIKLVGPVLFTFIWVKIGANINDFTTSMQKFMFAGLILAYFGPIGSMFLTLAVQRLYKLGRGKKDGQTQKSTRDQETSVRSSWQPNDPKIEVEPSLQSSRMVQKSQAHQAVPVIPQKPLLPVEEKAEKKVGLL